MKSLFEDEILGIKNKKETKKFLRRFEEQNKFLRFYFLHAPTPSIKFVFNFTSGYNKTTRTIELSQCLSFFSFRCYV